MTDTETLTPGTGSTAPPVRGGWAAALLACLASVVLFWPATSHGFLNHDDPRYVLENPLVTEGSALEATGAAFTRFHAGNWHPVTWLSHRLDVALFGLEAGAHHRTNVLLHGLTAGLLVLALARLTRRLGPSVAVAALFALHPLRVESVAWVSERKDLLAGAAFAAALWAHAARVRAETGSRARRAGLLLGLAFLFGLLAKPMVVTLPCVLLLLDRWPLGRRGGWGPLVREKAALWLLAGASCALTLAAQRAGGAFDTLGGLPFGARLANAGTSLVAYVSGTLWPNDLAIHYPHPALTGLGPWTGTAVLGLAAAAGTGAVAFASRARMPWLLVGWCWFLGMLVPVLGLVQVGVQARADRYTYLPSLGLLVALVWSADAAARRLRLPRALPAVLCALALAALVPATRRQLATWRSSESVFRRALAVTEANALAHVNLGEALRQEGRHEEARVEYEAALALRPELTRVRYDLALLHMLAGRLEEAVVELEVLVGSDPESPGVRANLGIALARLGRHAEARPHLEWAWALGGPMDAERSSVGQTLAWVLATDPDPARRDGPRALEVVRACLTERRTRGMLEVYALACEAAGDPEEAARARAEAAGL